MRMSPSCELTDDPLAGFLPPNNPDVHDGEGFAQYTVYPKTGLPSGTEITNMAVIVFDWNEPIDTPLIKHTIDAAPPLSQVDPLPAVVAGARFQVSWAGADDPAGSGIDSYDVFVSEDGGPYRLWLDHTNALAATYPGEYGPVCSVRGRATPVGRRPVPTGRGARRAVGRYQPERRT